MQVIKLSVLIFVSLMCVKLAKARGVCSSNDTIENYRQISDYLTTKVITDDAGVNVARAEQWAAELQGKSAKKRQQIFRPECKPLIRDLRLFTSMKLIVEKRECDSRSAEILALNESLATLINKNKLANRLERVVAHFARMYRSICTVPELNHVEMENMEDRLRSALNLRNNADRE